MDIVLTYQNVIEEKISKFSLPKEPTNLYDPLRYFLEVGGKRTRPVLTLLGCELFGVPGLKAINAATAIELFHNFTLIHDDIMDKAPLRRGRKTVHQKWNNDIAILSGDVLFIEAFKVMTQHDTKILPDLIDVFTQTAREVCEGQQLDMDFETSENVRIEDYIKMIRLKTSVLLGAALKMGAIVAEREDEMDVQNLYDFGVNVGIAFQLQDDILDLYATSNQFGKQIGGDILANKKTFLLLKAFELADNEDRDKLHQLLELEEGESKIKQVKEVFDRLEVKKYAEMEKERYFKEAIKNLQEIKVDKEQKQPLLELAESLMTRSF